MKCYRSMPLLLLSSVLRGRRVDAGDIVDAAWLQSVVSDSVCFDEGLDTCSLAACCCCPCGFGLSVYRLMLRRDCRYRGL